MNAIISILTKLLVYVMDICYILLNNYTLSIILFTLITKIILLPVSIWVHKNGIKMVRLMPELNRIKIKYFGDGDKMAEEQQALYKREKYNAFASIIPMFIQIILLISLIRVINITLGGTDLALAPIEKKGFSLLMPLAAGFSAYILSYVQNKINPLQKEQGRISQVSTMAISISVSLFLGAFVPIGVGLYWIFSNLFTIFQQLFLNAIVPPKKYIDFKELEESRKELKELNSVGAARNKKWFAKDPNEKRERADYKRFFNIANKHLVFYSERSGFYRYFESVISYLLTHSNIIIHYITSDPDDQIFKLAEQQPGIKPYYIGEKRLITLMMKMDANLVVMTMPDLNNYHIKRSYVKKDVEYVFMFHGPLSMHMAMRKGCINHFDTIFSVGPHTTQEVRKIEEVYNLPAKSIVECGYGLLERLIEKYASMAFVRNQNKTILIAPSWQPGNIMENSIHGLLNNLLGKGFKVIVRPHPQYVRKFAEKLELLNNQYSKSNDFLIQSDFSDDNSIFNADVLISDWSGAAYEYAFTTKKPVLFINTPMKIMNPEYGKLGIEPLEILLRNKVGIALDESQLGQTLNRVMYLLENQGKYHDIIAEMVKKYFYNLGSSGEVGGQYIIHQLKNKSKIKEEK